MHFRVVPRVIVKMPKIDQGEAGFGGVLEIMSTMRVGNQSNSYLSSRNSVRLESSRLADVTDVRLGANSGMHIPAGKLSKCRLFSQFFSSRHIVLR